MNATKSTLSSEANIR